MDFEGIRDVIVPVVSIIALPATVCVWAYFRYRARRDIQQTVRTAIENGQELTPEFLEILGGGGASGDRDLRRGVITSAVGLGLFLFSFAHVSMSEDGVPGVRATGLLILIIGLAFIFLWRFGHGRK